MPLVSIVVLNYNYARFVGQAIESALLDLLGQHLGVPVAAPGGGGPQRAAGGVGGLRL